MSSCVRVDLGVRTRTVITQGRSEGGQDDLKVSNCPGFVSAGPPFSQQLPGSQRGTPYRTLSCYRRAEHDIKVTKVCRFCFIGERNENVRTCTMTLGL